MCSFKYPSLILRFLLLFILNKNSSCIMNSGFRTTQPEFVMRNLGPSNTIRLETISKNLTGKSGEMIYFLIRNEGKEDEYVHLNVSDENGFTREIPPTEFILPSGSTKEIFVRMDYNLNNISKSPDLVTIQARGKRNTAIVKRNIFYPGNDYDSHFGEENSPFCYDRYVTGNCRYRTDPEYCFQYDWTAYAIVQNIGGLQTLRSIPEGLFVPSVPGPGAKERVRVWVKTSCCTPYVQIISSDPRNPYVGNACVVDVRELQGLHPGEIAGIVAGGLFLIIVIILIAVLIIRRRRARTILVGHTRSRECVSRE